jgi:hypothetical protein
MENPGTLKLVEAMGRRVHQALGQVTPEEFYDQEKNFDEESQLGRELLYLAANNEWARGTHEIIDLSSAHSVETTIRVQVDPNKITHEVIRERVGLVWLPLAVLAPPLPRHDAPPDSVVPPTPRVLDPSGNVVFSLPQTQARRWLAAALAEVMLHLAPLVAGDDQAWRAKREHRLVLSAALYRILRDDSVLGGASSTENGSKPSPDHDGERSDRIRAAREDLVGKLEKYSTFMTSRVKKAADHRAQWMIGRAARIIHALSSPTTLVVIPVDPAASPTEFSVVLPSRPLRRTPPGPRFRPRLRPRALLELGLVIASPEADRHIGVDLPEGVLFADIDSPVQAQIATRRPQSQRRLDELLDQIVAHTSKNAQSPCPVVQCLADLALQHLRLVEDSYPYHRGNPVAAQSGAEDQAFRRWSGQLRTHLTILADGNCTPRTLAAVRWARVQAQQDCRPLYRVLRASDVNPGSAHVRVPVVEEHAARSAPAPDGARIRLHVVAGEWASRYTACYAGLLNLAVLGLVLLLLGRFGSTFDPQVLGGVLTLFATIQASRIEQPDRSTLRGLLVSAGSGLAAASVLPPVLLGVALAFGRGHESQVVWWTASATGVQVGLVLVMLVGLVSGPSSRPGPERLILSGGLQIDYERVDVLHSRWWRTTTAAALMQGRPAHGYAVSQENGDLVKLLRSRPDSEGLSNILAQLTMGAGERALTMLVLRERQPEHWQASHHPQPVKLDTERLVAYESDIGVIDIYIGLPRDRAIPLAFHPIHHVLRRAGKDLRTVADIQMPSPPPQGGRPDRLWTRIAVSLRSREVAHFATFLAEVTAGIAATALPDTELVVDVSTQSPPRWFIGQSNLTDARLLTPQELDVVRPVVDEESDRDWLVLGIRADARSGAELDVLEHLQRQRPDLHVASLFSALMHGAIVMFLLTHDRRRHSPAPELILPCAEVLVAQPLAVPPRPVPALGRGTLVQMDVRSADQPGLLGLLLDTLERELTKELKVDRAYTVPTVLYGFSQVADGQQAESSMMLRLGLDQSYAEPLRVALDSVERSLRSAIISLARPAHAREGGRLGWWQARPVVTLRLAEVEPLRERRAPAA